MLPPEARHDFQDRPQWRSAVLATLSDAVTTGDRPVLAPMTLYNPGYFDEIVGGLRARGVDLRHVCLMASPATIRRRLHQRDGFGLAALLGRRDTWALERTEPCLDVLAHERFAQHIDADTRTLDEVVEEIAARLQLPLARPRLGPVRRQGHRVTVTVGHLRP